MARRNRDEFPPRIKRIVALQANQHCSFRGCLQPTSGPSEESAEAVNMTGVAAHIHGASSGPGSRRYLESMTPEERSDISNAIWLCTYHAALIDHDEVTYTADALRAMKRDHEAACAARQRNAAAAGLALPDLIALGPEVVFVGELLEVDDAELTFQLQHFVEGDVSALIGFIERFPIVASLDRYVLVNFLGDGRVLKYPPSLKKSPGGSYIVRCPVFASAERIQAADLLTDFALCTDHDLTSKAGHWAVVSGVEALPQRLKTCLSHQKGESPFHRDFGTRFAEYYRLLRGSPWFEQFLKLEVIRQAAIPYDDAVMNRRYTPLQCVERVFRIDLLSDTPTNGWLPIRIDLAVKGLGRWQHELSVCIPEFPILRPSLEELLAGPSADADARVAK